MRRKAAAPGGAYARLLYLALSGAVWQHGRCVEARAVGQRDAAGLAAALAGRGSHRDWLGCGPAGVLDEEVAKDLAALGWGPKGF